MKADLWPLKFSGQLHCLHCFQTEHFPYNEDFVKLNSSQELLPCNALSKLVYFSHRMSSNPQFQSPFKYVFVNKRGIHVNEKVAFPDCHVKKKSTLHSMSMKYICLTKCHFVLLRSCKVFISFKNSKKTDYFNRRGCNKAFHGFVLSLWMVLLLTVKKDL